MSVMREKFRALNNITRGEGPETIENSLAPSPLVGVSADDDLESFADSSFEAGELFEMGPATEDELHR